MRYGKLTTPHILGLLLALPLFLFACALFASPAYALEDWTSNAQDGSTDDLEFVFVDSQGAFSTDGSPIAVASFSKEISKAAIVASDGSEANSVSIDSSVISDSSALFELPDSSKNTVLTVFYSFANDSDVSYRLDIQKTNDDGTETDDVSNDSDVVTRSYSLDDDDTLVESSSTDSAISTYSTGSSTSRSRKTTTIVLDAGHGGSDSGATGYGLRESDLTLAIAKACRSELENYSNVNVIMTRDDDSYVGLTDRAQIAVDNGANLFVSIHINSSDASSAKGVEVWIPAESTWHPDFHELGEQLGEKVLERLSDLGLTYRGTKADYYENDQGKKLYYPDGSRADAFSVIRNCRQGGVPGILIEHGFISNAHDASLLADSSYLAQLGKEDALAIVDQLGLVPAEQPLYGFSDVTASTNHSSEIGWLAASGISTGFDDGTFRGMSAVTRQDAAAFLYRMAGSPDYTPSADDKSRFSDVSESTPHAKEIWWLSSVGIANGFSDGTFRGMSAVTRQDMAAFLQRFVIRYIDPSASDWDTSSSTVGFSDVNENTPHCNEILWLGSMEISSGFSDGTYRGASDVTRQDMAAFLYKTNQLPKYEASDSQKSAFSDVDSSTPHANEIWWLAASGISTGFDDGTFRGMSAVTRQDAAAFLYRMAGSPDYTPSADDKSRFSDVSESTPHAKEIWWLSSVGIANGFSDGTFRGMSAVTRQDMAAFLQRYYNRFSSNNQFKNWTPTAEAKKRFLDVDSSTTQSASVWWLAATGIASGYPDGYFEPDGTIVRQDLAAFLYRTNSLARRTFETEQTYTIMGKTDCTAQQLCKLYAQSGYSYPASTYASRGASSIDEFSRIVVEESTIEGVKPEVVFAQEMLETKYLQFGGDVKAEQCNFAGLGATGNGNPGLSFGSVRLGIRAQVQHLKAYASTDSLVQECVDPRFKYVTRGSATTLSQLSGKWATGSWYGKSIYSIIKRIPNA